MKANLFLLASVIMAQLVIAETIRKLDVQILEVNLNPLREELAEPINSLDSKIQELGGSIAEFTCCEDKKCTNLGMTWGFGSHSCEFEIDIVGCGGSPKNTMATDGACDAYKGDTPCHKTLPILCIKPMRYNRPAYPMVCKNDGGLPKEGYCGWSGGLLALSAPIQGCRLTCPEFADKWCEETVGCGYRMAEHHDGYYISGMDGSTYAECNWVWSDASSGGWNLYGISNLSGVGKKKPPKPTRYWTRINDQPANCWDSEGHL
jgi:hypothetical protein